MKGPPVSFRDNLQHLRATRNMTQEQLAMLLGVSRQSVTKWEAERAYPEMDKLLKLCDIFDCTLDDLVKGDLTARPTARPAATVPQGAPQDVCGYDEHMRRFARKVPTGIAIIVLGAGIGSLFEGQRVLPFANPDALFMGILLLGVLAGLAFIIPAGMEHSAFQKAHPYIEDFYTAEDKSAAGRRLACGVVGGVGVIFVGVMGLLLAEDGPYENVAASALIMLAAVGAWLIVHFALMYGRTNVAEYNKSVADDLELEEIANLTVEEEYKAALLQKKRHSQKVGAVCAVIMLVATAVGLLLLFAPLFGGQNIDDIDWSSGGSTYFWLAWPIGALLCGVAAILMNAFRKE